MLLRVPKSTLIILAAAIILFIILLSLIFFAFNNSNPPSATIPPTPTPIEVKIRQGNSPIKPKIISPIEDISGNTIKNPSQQISITTSEAITPENVRVVVSPLLPVKIQQGTTPNDIQVFPDPPEFWKPNVLYTITLYDSEDKLITSYNIKVPKFEVKYDPL